MDTLSQILNVFRVQADVFHSARHCGQWRMDKPAAAYISFQIVTEGRCWFQSPDCDAPVELERGDVVLINQGVPHQLCSAPGATAPVSDEHVIGFSDDVDQALGLVCGYLRAEHAIRPPLFEAMPDSVVVHCREALWSATIAPIVELIIQESYSEASGSEVTLNKLSDLLLVYVFRHRLAQSSASRGLAAAMRDRRINRALGLMHGEPGRNWDVDSLAEEANMSRSAFADRFKDLLGTTPKSYLTQWRMQCAYRWLRDDRVSVLDAAMRSGYANESAFAKAFKREVGVSPGQVRNAA